jgi:hypothetical protein
MILRLHPMTHQVAIRRLSSDCLDQTVLQSFLDTHLWIVEEELRMCIGIPPWFNSALSFLVAEIVREFARRNAPRKCPARWIRASASRASQRLERTLAKRHYKDGFVKFTGCESFQAVVGSVLERQRSLFWEELRRRKPLSSHSPALGGID